MPNEVTAFSGGEEIQGRRDQRTDLVKGSWAGGAEERLQLSEGQFDRIQVGTVRREEPELGPDGVEGGADRGMFVDREVIENHDVSRAQRRHQDLLDVGQEGPAVHGAVMHHRGSHAAGPQGTDEGGGLPVPMRHAHPQPLAPRRPAVPTGHLGGGAGLIDEDQPLGVEVGLGVEPGLATVQDIRTALLGRMPGLFLSVIR